MAGQSFFVALIAYLGLAHHVRADAGHMTVYQRKGCNPDDADYLKYDLPFPEEGGGHECTYGRSTLKGWPTDDQGNYLTWFDGRGIGAGCEIAILNQANRGTQFCGDALTIIKGDVNVGACRQLTLPVNHGVARCCGDQACQPVIPTRRDVTQIKRSAPFAPKDQGKRAGCTWEGEPPFDNRGAPQTVADDIVCSKNTTCNVIRSASVSKGSTNSFGVSESIELGEELIEIVTSTTTFSYNYS